MICETRREEEGLPTVVGDREFCGKEATVTKQIYFIHFSKAFHLDIPSLTDFGHILAYAWT